MSLHHLQRVYFAFTYRARARVFVVQMSWGTNAINPYLLQKGDHCWKFCFLIVFTFYVIKKLCKNCCHGLLNGALLS